MVVWHSVSQQGNHMVPQTHVCLETCMSFVSTHSHEKGPLPKQPAEHSQANAKQHPKSLADSLTGYIDARESC